MKGVSYHLPPPGVRSQSVVLFIPLDAFRTFVRIDGYRLISDTGFCSDYVIPDPNLPPSDRERIFGETHVIHHQLTGTIHVKAVPDPLVTKVAITSDGNVTGYRPRRTDKGSAYLSYFGSDTTVLSGPSGYNAFDSRSSTGTGYVYECEYILDGLYIIARKRRTSYYKWKVQKAYPWERCKFLIPLAAITTSFLEAITLTWINESTGASSSSTYSFGTFGNEPMPLTAFDFLPVSLGLWSNAIRAYGMLASMQYVEDLNYVLTKTACENLASLDINNVENIASLRDLSSMLPARGKSTIKTVAGLYLWYKYAVMPSYRDLKEIVGQRKKIADELTRTTKFLALRASQVKSYELPVGKMDVSYHTKVVLENSRFSILSRVVNALDSLGLAPTTANAWDLVPFSFVVDWFLDVGSLLEDVDLWIGEELNRYPLRVRTYSHRAVIKLELEPTSFGWIMDTDVEYVEYVRQVSTTLPKNRFEFGGSNPTSHIFELLALVVANW